MNEHRPASEVMAAAAAAATAAVIGVDDVGFTVSAIPGEAQVDDSARVKRAVEAVVPQELSHAERLLELPSPSAAAKVQQ